jgi:DNA ligase-1
VSLKLDDVVTTWRDVAANASRTAKIDRIAAVLASGPPAQAAVAAAWLAGELPQGRIGIGWAAIRSAGDVSATGDTSLTVAAVDSTFAAIADATGKGSAAGRVGLLRELFAKATQDEREFLTRLLLGDLRQGALDGLMTDAVARAAGVDQSAVRRALLYAGSIPDVARTALEEGAAGLDAFGLRMFTPLQPMLAQTVDNVSSALGRLGIAGLEYKLDGARIQVHRDGNDVRIFTRNLNDVTESLPDVVAAVLALPASELILDGEAIAMRADGRPLPFQTTMRRFGRRKDVEHLRQTLPLRCFFFDVLRADGTTLLDRPAAERFGALEDLVPDHARVRRTITDDIEHADAFLRDARRTGHEGIIAKSLDAPYDAGARGSAWLKIKPVHTLDLVVLAAEWGHGRRRGRLSNLHLGARGPDGFVMLGKTFKGLTDQMLEWQTHELLARETSRSEYVVHVRPELVVEIAFNDVQSSSRYPGGLALRFARVRAYRTDKSAADADTIDTVRAIHDAQSGQAPAG